MLIVHIIQNPSVDYICIQTHHKEDWSYSAVSYTPRKEDWSYSAVLYAPQRGLVLFGSVIHTAKRTGLIRRCHAHRKEVWSFLAVSYTLQRGLVLFDSVIHFISFLWIGLICDIYCTLYREVSFFEFELSDVETTCELCLALLFVARAGFDSGKGKISRNRSLYEYQKRN